jgi:DNA-binding winged helix-turn-helix (wHTH) protein/tetratricopeptide (TPR) repeat protein
MQEPLSDKEMQESSVLELARLYSERGEFRLAAKYAAEASEDRYGVKDFTGFFKAQIIQLRALVELEEHDQITQLKEALQDLVIRQGIELSSRTHYTLGVCASYKKQYDVAQNYFEKALAIGLQTDNKEDICYAISGLAGVYFFKGRYEEALREIYNLRVFFQILELPDVLLSSQILNGHILRKVGRYEEALDVFWQAYDQLKRHKNLYMYISVLYAMGATLVDMGDVALGRTYLNLARRSVDPTNQIYLSKAIEAILSQIGETTHGEYDIIFDSSTNTLVERKKGKVDFKSQFILLDLLRLFMGHPGEVFSKETLVQKVWKQSYDPAVHDNKVYVTIKRLRKLIEPDFDKPKYIFRSKNGYYLNRGTRILLNQ